MKIHYVLACLALVTSFSLPAKGEELSPEKRADIERLLDMTGAMALSTQMANAVTAQLFQVIKKARPDIPAKVLDALPAEVQATFEANMDSFKEAIIPIYHKHFSGSEIKEIIQFYSTDLGKKTVRLMPVLMQESMLAGQRWGQSLGPEIDRRIKARLKGEGAKI